MSKKAVKDKIPKEVKAEVDAIVKAFNERELKGKGKFYVTRYSGMNLFLDRCDDGRTGPMCHLRYNGSMDGWSFAIYKYSRSAFDPEERLFPGAQFINGTIEGALKAATAAYS